MNSNAQEAWQQTFTAGREATGAADTQPSHSLGSSGVARRSDCSVGSHSAIVIQVGGQQNTHVCE